MIKSSCIIFIIILVPEELKEASDPYASALDIEMGGGGLNMQAKNAIKTLLRDKDDEISRLKTENDELRLNLRNTQEERNNLHEGFTYLDKALMDWLAAMEMEADHEKIEHSLEELKKRMMDQKKLITDLEDEKKNLLKSIEEMKAKARILTEENIELKTWKHGEMVAHQTERQENAELVASLKEKLQTERDKNSRMERQLHRVESLNIESSRISDTEVTNLKKKLSEALKQLNSAVKERDSAREEVVDIHDKTRKLLFKLNLSNEIEDVGLSLEHARNIVYNRRGRCGSSLQNTASDTTAPLIPNGSMASTPRRFSGKGPSPTGSPRPDRMQLARPSIGSPVITEVAEKNCSSSQNAPKDKQNMTCKVCGKGFQEATNFEGACISHPDGAVRLHEGTELEVWSCCKTRDTIKGCLLARHVPLISDVPSTLSLVEH